MIDPPAQKRQQTADKRNGISGYGWVSRSVGYAETFVYGVPDSAEIAAGHLFNPHIGKRRWITGGNVGPEGTSCRLRQSAFWRRWVTDQDIHCRGIVQIQFELKGNIGAVISLHHAKGLALLLVSQRRYKIARPKQFVIAT